MSAKTKGKTVIIIGGGLAGLTTAVQLVDQGFQVSLLEKNKFLGGRASNSFDRTMRDPVPIGPHIFVRGYKYFEQFLKHIGAKENISWERNLFLELVYKNMHYQFRMTDMPTSLRKFPRMLKYPFTSLGDKLTNLRVGAKIYFSKTSDLEKLDEQRADEFLKAHGVSQNSIDKMWRFFVLSLLNVPIEKCSAAELCLLAKYWTKVNHKEIGFAKAGLGDIYTKKAVEYITQKGGKVYTELSVKRIVCNAGKIEKILLDVNGRKKELKADVYVSSLNPLELNKLLPPRIRALEFFSHLGEFEGVPYLSTNLWFDRKISHKKFWALLNDSHSTHYMNLDFYDESNIYESRKDRSYITSNIIYSHAFNSLSDKEIVKKTLEEIKMVFPHTDAKLIHSHVHRIPYVIYAPCPGMRKHKLPNKTPLSNFYLCGDWTNREMTQCMEAAVQSGYQCAETVSKM